MLTRRKKCAACSSSSNLSLASTASSFCLSSAPFFFLTSFLCLLLLFLKGSEAIFAQGNLAIVFEAESGRTSEHSPLHANLTDLWCQATEDGTNRLPIKNAKFVQVVPPPTRVHKGHVYGNRSHLRFGWVTPKAAGKYKCEITADTNPEDFVTGNLFVYMRPVLYTNGSLRLDQASDGEPFHFVSTLNKVIRGETARLTCPAMGYPIPTVQWLRDGQPLTRTANNKILVLGNELHIREADDPDEGVYRCVASNRFPTEVDGQEEDFEVVLDQHLRVASSLSWLIPLIVIFVLLLLLFIVIYSCAAWKRYKHAQYNVAQREKCLRKAEEQRLNDEDDE